MMRKCLMLSLIILGFISCDNKKDDGKFSVSGEIKNTDNQKIFLDQLYFSQKDPEVLDTTEMKNGKFNLSAIATEEGLYRIRMEKTGTGFIFINDKPVLNFKADMKNLSLEGPDFHTPANSLLKNLLTGIEAKRKPLLESAAVLENLKKSNGSDSAMAAEMTKVNGLSTDFNNFIIHYIDTSSDPVVAMFTLGFTKNIDPAKLKDGVPGLLKRFPQHKGIASIVAQYNQMMAMQNQPPQQGLSQGSTAPDIKMNDVNDKPFSLSQLKGKYVLIDFWASWCAPCRRENPNVVAAYKKYKDKNFTVLGVSLDDDKAAWAKAIKDDSLLWTQVSDLKQWNSPVVSLYGFDGIPYNVLIDPQGIIIATSLREDDLEKKLSEVLK